MRMKINIGIEIDPIITKEEPIFFVRPNNAANTSDNILAIKLCIDNKVARKDELISVFI